jgi:curli biogenesis system outer membrane secretion channel CsgG
MAAEGIVIKRACWVWVAMALACATVASGQSPAPVEAAAAPQAAAAPGERVAVTIFEFRSSLPNVSGKAATDMFKTALVQTGRFQVVERSRLNEGVLKEKQLNAGGYTTGDIAQQQLRGARYVFEGIVSEANVAEQQRGASITIAGVSLGGASITDSIAIDVRVVDAANGDILDAVVVRKPIKSSETSLGIVGSALPGMKRDYGHRQDSVPDAQATQRTSEGADRALRAAIDEAVAKLAGRFGH